jgi:hypothetical protein
MLDNFRSEYLYIHEDEPRLGGFAVLLSVIGLVVSASCFLGAMYLFGVLLAGVGGK